MNWDEFQIWSAALCSWREARDQGRDGIRAVLHVIRNRAEKRRKSWAEIVYQPLQFSSMTYPQDPQLAKVPVEPDPQFVDCYELATVIYQGGDYDITRGALFYFADYIEKPSWAKNMTETAKVGRHIFFA